MYYAADIRLIVDSLFRGNPTFGVLKYRPSIYRMIHLALSCGYRTVTGVVNFCRIELNRQNL